jgi:hypothetical protein
MWELTNIPKTLFLYWGRNKPLSYLRYLTVKSFMNLNPDWKVTVYYPKDTCFMEDWDTGEQSWYKPRGENYFYGLIKEQNEKLQIKEFNFAAEMGIPNDTPEVIKSDILRLYLLHKEGGVWSDFDILYIKPISKLMIAHSDMSYNSYICFKTYHSIGFLMGAFDNHLYSSLYREAIEILNKKSNIDYQRIGSRLFKEQRVEQYAAVGNLYQVTVYPVAYNEVEKLFHFDMADLSASIGVHWFGGNQYSSIMDNRLTPDNIDDFKDCTIKRLIKEMTPCLLK